MNSAVFLNNLGAKLLIRYGCNTESQDLLKGSLGILQWLTELDSVADLSCIDGICGQHLDVKKALQLAKLERIHSPITFATQDFDNKSYLFVYLQPIVIDYTSFDDPCCLSILAAIVIYNKALNENLAYLQGPGKSSHLKSAIALYEMALNVLPYENVSIGEHLRAILFNNIGAMKYEQCDYNGAVLHFAHLQDHVAEMSGNIQANLPDIILNLGLLSSLQLTFVAVAA